MESRNRQDFFIALAKIKIERLTEKETREMLIEYGYDQGDKLSNLVSYLQEKYSGVTNGFLSDVYELLFGEEIDFIGNVTSLHKCPCCEFNTLNEIYDYELGSGYDICTICGWEDDGTKDIDKYSGVNRGNINGYREKMKNNQNYYYREKYKKNDIYPITFENDSE